MAPVDVATGWGKSMTGPGVFLPGLHARSASLVAGQGAEWGRGNPLFLAFGD